MTDRVCCSNMDQVLVPGFFKALCHPSRLAILVRLLERPELCSVSGLAAESGLDVSVVSRHLAILRDAGIVTVVRQGRESCHRVDGDLLAGTMVEMAEAVLSCCGSLATQSPTATAKENKGHGRTEDKERCVTGLFQGGYQRYT